MYLFVYLCIYLFLISFIYLDIYLFILKKACVPERRKTEAASASLVENFLF